MAGLQKRNDSYRVSTNGLLVTREPVTSDFARNRGKNKRRCCMRALLAAALVAAGCERAAAPSGWVKASEVPSVKSGDPRITAPADGGAQIHLSSALVELKGGRVSHLDQMWTAYLGDWAYLVGTAQGTGSPDVFRGSQTWVALDDVLRLGVHGSAEDTRKAYAAYSAEVRATEPFTHRRPKGDPPDGRPARGGGREPRDGRRDAAR
jgi:hypothetical protein